MDSSENIAQAVAAVGRIDAVPILLKVLCETSGMRSASVVRVSGGIWTACAVRDGLRWKISPGSQLPFISGLAADSSGGRAPIVIEQASSSPRASTYRGETDRSIESFISMPIIIGGRRHFGALCAFDSKAAKVADPRIVSMCQQFAGLIAFQLKQQSLHEREHAALLSERATSELREQFIAILGHDLRNPLQAVLAGGELLERRLTDPALRSVASRIKTNVKRMSSLIDDVLDFARGRLGGGIELELDNVENVNHRLMAVAQELQDAHPDSQIISTINVERAVRCDSRRLQQVAANLLANALTHGKPQSPVKLTVNNDENNLVLDVWNAGEPIAPESLTKIFEPFWRHSGSASRNGLGLGLHICSQIVNAHDGSISVKSSHAHGTQFTARFPLKDGASSGNYVAVDQPATEAASISRSAPDVSMPLSP